jgi:hypothetical protein
MISRGHRTLDVVNFCEINDYFMVKRHLMEDAQGVIICIMYED